MSKKVKILIATHKKYKMPEDSMYLPVHVGATGKYDEHGNELDLGYQKDNSGENISELNTSFCELTGLYWAWKNLDCDFVGLAHYRRHFSVKKKKDKWDSVLKYEEISPMLEKIKVFVPQKRKYYIESLYSHYKHTHYAIHLDVTREIISEIYPEYVECYDKVVNRTSGYMFNMMIMQKKFFDSYCEWLFDILFQLRERIDMPELSAFQGRFYGRVSEIIFNVWLEYQLKQGIILKSEIKELRYIHMEKTNWLHKGGAFIKAKFFHEKYEGSF